MLKQIFSTAKVARVADKLKMGSFLCALGFLAISTGCSRSTQVSLTDPKGTITGYISKSFSVGGPDDRKQLMTFLTGEAKDRLSSWSDEQFRQAFIDSKRQFIKLAFSEIKPVSSSEMQVTYEISYMDQSKGSDARVTTKKLAQLTSLDGKWLINDVHNIKELVEYKNEMSLP